MLEELNISMTIDVKNKMLYIGEENSSGAEYKYNNVKDLEDRIEFYLEHYYLKEIEYENNKEKINNTLNNELEDEEEIILDVYLTLWNNKDKLDINKSMTSYIAGITKNLILKKARQQKFLENIEEYQEKLANIQNIELDYVESQKNKIIINELEKMKKEDREIFTEYYYEERKIKEISIMFKISESKVKSKLFRIRKKLKNILKEGGYDVNG